MVENPNWQEADLLAICRAQLERQLYWYIRWSNWGEYQQEPRLDSSSSEIHTTKIEGPRVHRTFFFFTSIFYFFPWQITLGKTLREQGLAADCNIHAHFSLCGGKLKTWLLSCLLWFLCLLSHCSEKNSDVESFFSAGFFYFCRYGEKGKFPTQQRKRAEQ